jgi:hypothetical protein
VAVGRNTRNPQTFACIAAFASRCTCFAFNTDNGVWRCPNRGFLASRTHRIRSYLYLKNYAQPSTLTDLISRPHTRPKHRWLRPLNAAVHRCLMGSYYRACHETNALHIHGTGLLLSSHRVRNVLHLGARSPRTNSCYISTCATRQ